MLKRLALTTVVCLAAAPSVSLTAPEPGPAPITSNPSTTRQAPKTDFSSRAAARDTLLTNARSLQRDVDAAATKASTAQTFAASLSAADGQALQSACRDAISRPADPEVRHRFEELVARYRGFGADAIVSYCMTPPYQQLRRDVQTLTSKLESVGDDAQLANVDLQNVLQKQQQTLQMMSNISKMLYDTAISVIRKMGG
jgi:hypothetical protein